MGEDKILQQGRQGYRNTRTFISYPLRNFPMARNWGNGIQPREKLVAVHNFASKWTALLHKKFHGISMHKYESKITIIFGGGGGNRILYIQVTSG